MHVYTSCLEQGQAWVHMCMSHSKYTSAGMFESSLSKTTLDFCQPLRATVLNSPVGYSY